MTQGANLTSPRGLLANHQGSIVAVADTGGNALAINGYDAWGVPNPGNLGRFLQTDPVGYEDQANLYAYVANDPVNGTDPTGNDYAAALAVAMVVVTKLKDFSLHQAVVFYALILAVCVAVHYLTYTRAIFRLIKSMGQGE